MNLQSAKATASSASEQQGTAKTLSYLAHISPKPELQSQSPLLSVGTSITTTKLVGEDISLISSSPVSRPSSPVSFQRDTTPLDTSFSLPVSSSLLPTNSKMSETPKQKLASEETISESQIAITLKKRLSYVAFKVKKGWQTETIERVLKLTNEKYDKISPAIKRNATLALKTTAKMVAVRAGDGVLGIAIKRSLLEESNGKRGNNRSAASKKPQEYTSQTTKKVGNTSVFETAKSVCAVEAHGIAAFLTSKQEGFMPKISSTASIGLTKLTQSDSPKLHSDCLAEIAPMQSTEDSTASYTSASNFINSLGPTPITKTTMLKPSVSKPKFNSINTNIIPNHLPIPTPAPKIMPSLPSREKYSQPLSRPAYPSSYLGGNVQPQYPSYSQPYSSYTYPPLSLANNPPSTLNPIQNYISSNYPYPQQQPQQHANYASINSTIQPPYSQYPQYQPLYRPLERNYHVSYPSEYSRQLPHSTGYPTNGPTTVNNFFSANPGNTFLNRPLQKGPDSFYPGNRPPYPGSQWPNK
ncbi:hypothetical protein HK100_010305 [Physocladia obscura]|uniref:Uncharacterized protein n=1 Tax=Physocladia obscura TaxID=109957 RepID=A0AAD5XH82_9FUNG|nr:hypothetical protein HK100_010305 [Physocladia obscura]